MRLKILVLLLLAFASSLASEPICTTTGKTADSLIQALPHDSSTYAKIGILYANMGFLNHAPNAQQTADSAVWYLGKALQFQPTPENRAYNCVARLLRVREDNFWQKISGKTREKAELLFAECDSLAKENPDNLTVQFLTANLFTEANALSQKNYYWQRGLEIFQALSEYGRFEHLFQPNPGENFFNAEVFANILLNSAKLEFKLSDKDKTDLALARLKWQAAICLFPMTLAATNAAKQLEKIK